MNPVVDSNSFDNISKLRWACRRGMLELDVLLGNFLEEAYTNLSLAEKANFVEFLSQPDPDLFAWLLGNAQPENPHMADMAEKVRQHAYSRFRT